MVSNEWLDIARREPNNEWIQKARQVLRILEHYPAEEAAREAYVAQRLKEAFSSGVARAATDIEDKLTGAINAACKELIVVERSA